MRNSLAGRRRLTSAVAVAAMVLGSVVGQAEPAAAVPQPLIAANWAEAGGQDSLILDASCPEGLQLLGGGARITGEKSDKVVLTESWPLNSRTWRSAAQEVYPGWDPPWQLTAYAICGKPLDGWELREGGSGPGVTTFKTSYTTKCSNGKKAFSAGGRVSTTGGLVGLTMIRPDGPLTMGRASARRVPAGRDVDWWVASYAICAYPVPGQQYIDKIENDRHVIRTCPGVQTVTGVGGGGGLVDLGPVFLQTLAPSVRPGLPTSPVGSRQVNVEMTAIQNGGTLAQATCAD